MRRNKDTYTELTDDQILKIVRDTILLFQKRLKRGKVAVSSSDLIRFLDIEERLTRRSGTTEIIGTWIPVNATTSGSATLAPKPGAPYELEPLDP